MKIDNMREEHQEKLIRDAEKLAEQQANEEADTRRKRSLQSRERRWDLSQFLSEQV